MQPWLTVLTKLRRRPLALLGLATAALLAFSISLPASDAHRAQAAPDPAGDPVEEDSRPYPVDVTAKSRANPETLARLEKPGKVFFREDFEGKSFDAWFNRIGEKEGRVRFGHSASDAHRGQGALELETTDEQGASCGAGASYWFHPGYDQVYFRRYVRFAEDYDPGNLNHVGGTLYAVAGDNRWGEMGKAGVRPEGNDRFGAAFEPWNDWRRVPLPGAMMLYTYWMDMKQDRSGKYWGNNLQPEKEDRVVLERGKWHCLEHMIRVGTPGQADGEMAAWIDGKLYVHFTGFRWCTEPLKLKRIALGLYVHESRRKNRVGYDDVVLSTGYVGPEPEDGAAEK